MDQELKQYLDGMKHDIVELVAGEVGTLHIQIQQSEARLSARFDSIDARMKLQAGLIQSGARAIARFGEFSENSEARWIDLLSRVEVLERKIEGGAR